MLDELLILALGVVLPQSKHTSHVCRMKVIKKKKKKGLVYRKIGSVICDIQVPKAAHSLKNKVAVTVVTECCNSILLYYSFLLSKNKNVP